MSLLRELDAEVAEFVMDNDYRPYSTVIQAAWDVVEKLNLIVAVGQGVYMAGFPIWQPGKLVEIGYETTTNTAPLAICLAALKAKGRDISKYKELMR